MKRLLLNLMAGLTVVILIVLVSIYGHSYRATNLYVRSSFEARSSAGWEFPDEWFVHETADQRAQHTPLLGRPMPPLNLSNWINGQRSMDDLKGKIVVIDFWAIWCGSCIAAMPHDNELYNKYHLQGVEFIGVCTSLAQGRFEEIVKRVGIQYPNACDSQLVSEKQWRVMWYPTYAVVDRSGLL